MSKRIITDIIIHEADTPTGKEFHAEDIDQWHIQRGFKRSEEWRTIFNPALKAIGYHYVICIDGSLESGRNIEEIGAHCQGHNSNSIGICLIGKGKYTVAQWSALKQLVSTLILKYPSSIVRGHCQYDTAIAQGKTCPDFNVEDWMINDGEPLEGHIA